MIKCRYSCVSQRSCRDVHLSQRGLEQTTVTNHTNVTPCIWKLHSEILQQRYMRQISVSQNNAVPVKWMLQSWQVVLVGQHSVVLVGTPFSPNKPLRNHFERSYEVYPRHSRLGRSPVICGKKPVMSRKVQQCVEHLSENCRISCSFWLWTSPIFLHVLSA